MIAHVFNKAIERPRVLLKKESMGEWIYSTDVDYGGTSQASIVMVPHLKFTGHLSPETVKPIQKTLYAGCRSKQLPKILLHQPTFNLKPFHHLNIRLKGDGKRWMVNLTTDTLFKGTLWQFPIYTSKEWETYQIGLDEFYHTINGRLTKRQLEMNSEKIMTFGFSIMDQEGPFELQVESIEAE